MHAQITTQKYDRNGVARGGVKNRRTAARGSAEAKTAAFPAKTGHKRKHPSKISPRPQQ